MSIPAHCSDVELATAFEGAEAEACRAFCTAAAALYPSSAIRVIEAAGGYGLIYGPGDPLNAVKGPGLNGPVDTGEWTRLEQVFFATRSPVVVDLAPLADEAFIQLLMRRGYTIGSFETVTCRSVGEAEKPVPNTGSEVTFSEVDPAEAEAVRAWTRVLGVGFADGGEPIKFAVDFGRVRAHMAAMETEVRTFMLLASLDGKAAGGAALSLSRGTPRSDGSPRPLVALMSGAAVLPEYRRRGIQQALTRQRLALASRHGCAWATLCVRAGSASHRNAARAGFQVAYTRPQLILSPPGH